MGKSQYSEANQVLKKGPWTPQEDQKLLAYIQQHGHGSWRALPNKAGHFSLLFLSRKLHTHTHISMNIFTNICVHTHNTELCISFFCVYQA